MRWWRLIDLLKRWIWISLGSEDWIFFYKGVHLGVSSDDVCYGCRFSVVGCLGVSFWWGCLLWWVLSLGVFVGVFVFRCSAYIRRLLFVLHRSLFVLCRIGVFNKLLLIQKKKIMFEYYELFFFFGFSKFFPLEKIDTKYDYLVMSKFEKV